jgi:hypothetical protein
MPPLWQYLSRLQKKSHSSSFAHTKASAPPPTGHFSCKAATSWVPRWGHGCRCKSGCFVAVTDTPDHVLVRRGRCASRPARPGQTACISGFATERPPRRGGQVLGTELVVVLPREATKVGFRPRGRGGEPARGSRGSGSPGTPPTQGARASYASFLPNSPANQNAAEFCDPRIDRQIERGLTKQATNADAARGLWERIDLQTADQAPLVRLVNPKSVDVLSKRTGNHQYSPACCGMLIDQLWVR